MIVAPCLRAIFPVEGVRLCQLSSAAAFVVGDLHDRCEGGWLQNSTRVRIYDARGLLIPACGATRCIFAHHFGSVLPSSS